MQVARLKYIIKDKVDYTNEVINNKQGVCLRKLKFLLNNFEFQQRKTSRLHYLRKRARAFALFVKQQRFLHELAPVRTRMYLNILQHCKTKITGPLTSIQLSPQKQLFAEKLRYANLLVICRTRNLLFTFFYNYKHLFHNVSLPVLFQFCMLFLGTASFFPFEL